MIATYSAKSVPRQPSSSDVCTSSVLQNEDQTSLVLQKEEQTDGRLSAWETWLLHKARQEREADEVKLREQQEAEKKMKQEQAERERKKTEAAAKIEAWIAEYDAAMKLRRRLQQKRDKAEQELKEEKKLELLNKAKENFQVCSITLVSTANVLCIIFWLCFNNEYLKYHN